MEQKAARILQACLYATVATSDAGKQPWNSPVYCVHDDQLNLYWASARSSQHSQNIQANPKVFIVIYDSTMPWGTGEGVFIQATATVVDDPAEIAKACALRLARVAEATQPPSDFSGDRPRRIYRATPEHIWTNQDASVNGFFIDQRAELDVAKLRTLLGS
jgi:nitroimidazol reductase NimA-like FMN-containing flavoprotein (pyridoxamine 5'-phosphate oxidase superfamily)